jgi:hypothetical protein
MSPAWLLAGAPTGNLNRSRQLKRPLLPGLSIVATLVSRTADRRLAWPARSVDVASIGTWLEYV